MGGPAQPVLNRAIPDTARTNGVRWTALPGVVRRPVQRDQVAAAVNIKDAPLILIENFLPGSTGLRERIDRKVPDIAG